MLEQREEEQYKLSLKLISSMNYGKAWIAIRAEDVELMSAVVCSFVWSFNDS